MKDLDEQFDDIVQEALHKADTVDCSPAEYRAGLKYMIDEIRTAIQASSESTGDDE